MLLGIVLHASLPYFSRIAGLESSWPADDDQSILLFLVFDFIHTWRMPTFFLLAGFFAHLVLDRRSTSVFVLDRLKRIALPLVLFGAVMAVIIPPIWVYGWYGSISPDVFRDALKERQDLDSSGELVAHLWFLYYLLLMYAALIAFRSLGRLWKAQTIIRPAGLLPHRQVPGERSLHACTTAIDPGGGAVTHPPGRQRIKARLAPERAGRAIRYAVFLLRVRTLRPA